MVNMWSVVGSIVFAHRPLTIFSAVVKFAFVAFTVFVYGKIALIVVSVKKQSNSFSRASIQKSYCDESTETDSVYPHRLKSEKVNFISWLAKSISHLLRGVLLTCSGDAGRYERIVPRV
jgi:hypothetical protein